MLTEDSKIKPISYRTQADTLLNLLRAEVMLRMANQLTKMALCTPAIHHRAPKDLTSSTISKLVSKKALGCTLALTAVVSNLNVFK